MKKSYISLLAGILLCAASFAQVFSPDGDTEPVPVQPSRSVSLKQNQFLDIEYPGSGWIYLGEMEAASLLRYAGRRLEENKTFFTLRAVSEGTAVLHFYKNDALAGGYIDDYLQVAVNGSSRTADHVLAPSYASVVPPLPSFKSSKSSAVVQTGRTDAASETVTGSPSFVAVPRESAVTQVETPVTLSPVEDVDKAATVIQNTGSSSRSVEQGNGGTVAAASVATSGAAETATETGNGRSADEVFSLAKEAYTKGDYAKCLSYLDDFFTKAVEHMDEGLFLQAQALEAPSSSRNIKKSLAVYESLIRQYPESAVWEKAKDRITYIERLYFNIH